MPEKDDPWPESLYRNYIVGGLIAVVVVIIVAVLIVLARGQSDSLLPIYLGGGAATLFLLGLFGILWVQILSGNLNQSRLARQESVDTVPPLASLKSWTNLYRSMVLYGGSRDLLVREVASTNRRIVEWLAWVSLFTHLPLLAVWLYLFGVIPAAYLRRYLPPVLLLLIVIILLRTFMTYGGKKEDYKAKTAGSLGLSVEEAVSHGRLFSGTRRGRQVALEIDGSRSAVTLEVPFPAFTAASSDGKFAPLDALPQSLRPALDLPKAKRWRGVDVSGGRQGLRIERHGRGANMWLYDLWLAERLAAAAKGEPPA